MIDTDSERELQTRFERLRANGQLCPCQCANCPLQDVVREIEADTVKKPGPAAGRNRADRKEKQFTQP